MQLKKGTIVWESEIGYYNFYYPTKRSRKILTDCDARPINHWIKYDDKYPFAVPVWALDPKKLEDRVVVIWIDNDKLGRKNVY